MDASLTAKKCLLASGQFKLFGSEADDFDSSIALSYIFKLIAHKIANDYFNTDELEKIQRAARRFLERKDACGNILMNECVASNTKNKSYSKVSASHHLHFEAIF